MISLNALSVPACAALLWMGGSVSSKAAEPPLAAQQTYNLSSLDWKLWGYRPFSWRLDFDFNELKGAKADQINVPAKVPGSVQKALKDAGAITDWNVGDNYQGIEWIEHRHWIFCARIPDEWVKKGSSVRLRCQGLDDNGVVLVNGKDAGRFNNTFLPYSFDITPFLKDSKNTLAIVFECPPNFLGQICYTSKIREWKPRFSYGWDWIPRIVQVGVWDDVLLDVRPPETAAVERLDVSAEADADKDEGTLALAAEMTAPATNGKIRVRLGKKAGDPVFEETLPAAQLKSGKEWSHLKIKRWWPNGQGDQELYELTCALLGPDGNAVQTLERRVGFKHVAWLPCKGAQPNTDPWVCSVNGKPVFLQGVNWTPIRPNFADLAESDYRKLLAAYKDLGANTLRVWGGGFPEKQWFYDLCDEMGLMLWQEFPLSSSGLDNYPPTTADEIVTMSKIVESYVARLRYHVSLLLWCGGNELYEMGDTAPVSDKHPMIRDMKAFVNAKDPARRFVTGSPSGIANWGGLDTFGKGICWDVHGPWSLPYSANDHTMKSVGEFWGRDDSCFHSEVGVAGAQSADLINKYRGPYAALPAIASNPLWRPVNWWIEWNDFLADHGGKEPASLEEYVAWSQGRQAEGLSIALKANKSRFPACGGFIIWMGHDSFPCPVNTSILDFDGNPKPAALEVSKIWKSAN